MGGFPPAPRRAFLTRAAALGAAAFLRPALASAIVRPRFKSYPFTLGVASGAPRPDGFVIWTRLAPEPLAGGGLGPEPIPVRWEVAHDDAFRRIAARGVAVANAQGAHSVHVEVEGLAPRRDYHYRFMAGDEVTAVGRACTAPAAEAGEPTLRLAFASCQQYEQGYYIAHRHLAREGVDLVAFVGDYIYESSWGRQHVRRHSSAAAPRTLAEYRDRYAQYKGDPDLQASHAAAPWIVTWDDHEVENDYADDRSETLDPDFLARRAAAYRAFIEHMPVRRSVLLENGGIRLYDRHAWGRLATLHVLDDRQYRSHQACARTNRGGSNVVGPECTARLDPALTLLGREQERWLDDGLAASKAKWNVLVQQTLFVPAGVQREAGRTHWTDGWDGYPAARERLLRSLSASRASNPVIIGGDVHATYVADVHAQPDDDASPIIASEFCGTSITSQGPGAKRVEGIASSNPHIRYANEKDRGYVVLDFGDEGLDMKLRAVETVKRPDASIATAATFHVAHGRPGPVRS